MSRMRLLNQSKGQNFEGFCIVKGIAVRSNSKGNPYLDLILADGEGEGTAKLWDYSREIHGEYNVEDIIKVRGSIVLWKDAEQMKIERIRHITPEDPVDLSSLIPCAPFDPVWLYDQLYSLADEFSDDDIRRLVQYIMKEHREQLLIYPAAVKLHHATRGGLLHHTWDLVELAKGVLAVYPQLDSDLVYAGVILHDIGKLAELEAGPLGIAGSYSTEGQLLGHINIGVSEIAQTAELLGIPNETAVLLEHMLLSHHGQPEFGSPRYPMFPEAEVLSQLDLLDSRLYEMFAALEGIRPGGFTERMWALDNRQLYQHRHGKKSNSQE